MLPRLTLTLGALLVLGGGVAASEPVTVREPSLEALRYLVKPKGEVLATATSKTSLKIAPATATQSTGDKIAPAVVRTLPTFVAPKKKVAPAMVPAKTLTVFSPSATRAAVRRMATASTRPTLSTGAIKLVVPQARSVRPSTELKITDVVLPAERPVNYFRQSTTELPRPRPLAVDPDGPDVTLDGGNVEGDDGMLFRFNWRF